MLKDFKNIEEIVDFYKEMISKEDLTESSENLEMSMLITSIIVGEVLFKSGIPIENLEKEVSFFIENNSDIIRFVSGVLKSKNE